MVGGLQGILIGRTGLGGPAWLGAAKVWGGTGARAGTSRRASRTDLMSPPIRGCCKTSGWQCHGQRMTNELSS
jgi:hypothetical protein